MENVAAYFWMIASFLNMIIFFAISYKTKKLFHLLTAIMWFNCAMWGMTVSAVNVPFIKLLNTVILPIDAGIFGLAAGIMKLNAAIHDEHI